MDTVLLYGEGADAAALSRAVRTLADSGVSVLAQKAVPEKLRYRQLLRFEDGRIEP